jgi:hypothetical protein
LSQPLESSRFVLISKPNNHLEVGWQNAAAMGFAKLRIRITPEIAEPRRDMRWTDGNGKDLRKPE